MKGAVFGVGIVLLVIAFVLFFMGYSIVSKHESYGVLGDLRARALRQGYWMELIGGILGIAGLGVCVYGAVSQPRMRTYARTSNKAQNKLDSSQLISIVKLCGCSHNKM